MKTMVTTISTWILSYLTVRTWHSFAARGPSVIEVLPNIEDGEFYENDNLSLDIYFDEEVHTCILKYLTMHDYSHLIIPLPLPTYVQICKPSNSKYVYIQDRDEKTVDRIDVLSPEVKIQGKKLTLNTNAHLKSKMSKYTVTLEEGTVWYRVLNFQFLHLFCAWQYKFLS